MIENKICMEKLENALRELRIKNIRVYEIVDIEWAFRGIFLGENICCDYIM